MGDEGAIICEEQLHNQLFSDLGVGQEAPQVKQTSVGSEADVDAICQVFFSLAKHHAEENGEQGGRKDAALLDAI
jgi:hypothetical protein